MNFHPQLQLVARRIGGGLARTGMWSRLARVGRMTQLLVCLVAALTWCSTLKGTETDTPMDFQVKAAFLVNFPKFVDWKPGTFADTNTPIVVGIYGDDNMAGEFERMIEGGRAVEGRPIVLQRITSEQQITNCQVLFIARSERHRTKAVIEKTKGTGVLTVGETEDFLEEGGIINMVPRDRKIRLQVNLSVARDAQLNISARLLKVADVVKGKPD